MNVFDVFRRLLGRGGSAAAMGVLLWGGLSSVMAEQPPMIPRQLPPGMQVVKTFSTSAGGEIKADAGNQLVLETFQRSEDMTEHVEEYADGSRGVSYVVPPFLLMEHRVGPVVLDLRRSGGDDGEGNLDYFEELRWIQLQDTTWRQEENGDWTAEHGLFQLTMDGELGLPREFSGPRIQVNYSFGESPPGRIQVPENLLAAFRNYEDRLNRKPVYLLGEE